MAANGSGKQPLVVEDGGDRAPTEKQTTYDDGYYEIETVLDKRIREGSPQYKIKWLGYPKKYNSWEPMENLQRCSFWINEFEKGVVNDAQLRRSNRNNAGETLSEASEARYTRRLTRMKKRCETIRSFNGNKDLPGSSSTNPINVDVEAVDENAQGIAQNVTDTAGVEPLAQNVDGESVPEKAGRGDGIVKKRHFKVMAIRKNVAPVGNVTKASNKPSVTGSSNSDVCLDAAVASALLFANSTMSAAHIDDFFVGDGMPRTGVSNPTMREYGSGRKSVESHVTTPNKEIDAALNLAAQATGGSGVAPSNEPKSGLGKRHGDAADASNPAGGKKVKMTTIGSSLSDCDVLKGLLPHTLRDLSDEEALLSAADLLRVIAGRKGSTLQKELKRKERKIQDLEKELKRKETKIQDLEKELKRKETALGKSGAL